MGRASGSAFAAATTAASAAGSAVSMRRRALARAAARRRSSSASSALVRSGFLGIAAALLRRGRSQADGMDVLAVPEDIGEEAEPVPNPTDGAKARLGANVSLFF